MLLGNVIFWGVTSIVLILSIVISIRRIWLPYSKFLVFFIACYMFLNFMSLLNMPNWINHIGFGITFLIFPILDGISTNIALTKYGGKEANPIMAWIIKKISIRFAIKYRSPPVANGAGSWDRISKIIDEIEKIGKKG